MMEVPPMDPPGAPEQVCHQGRVLSAGPRRCLAAMAIVFLLARRIRFTTKVYFLSDERISLALNVWCNRELTEMRRNGGRVFPSLVQTVSICLSMFNLWLYNKLCLNLPRGNAVPVPFWVSRNSFRVSRWGQLFPSNLKWSLCCNNSLQKDLQFFFESYVRLLSDSGVVSH